MKVEIRAHALAAALKVAMASTSKDHKLPVCAGVLFRDGGLWRCDFNRATFTRVPGLEGLTPFVLRKEAAEGLLAVLGTAGCGGATPPRNGMSNGGVTGRHVGGARNDYDRVRGHRVSCRLRKLPAWETTTATLERVNGGESEPALHVTMGAFSLTLPQLMLAEEFPRVMGADEFVTADQEPGKAVVVAECAAKREAA